MEHGGSSFHHGQPKNSISNSKQLQKEGESSRNNNEEVVQVGAPRQDNRNNMPMSNVLRVMRKGVPTHSKITDGSKITMVECVSEFISFITSEAKIRCQRDLRITITAEDLLWAMQRLGFHDYAEPCTLFLRRYRLINASAHRGSNNIPTKPKIANDRVQPPPPPPSLTPTFPITPNPPYPYPMEMGGLHKNPYHDPMQMGGIPTNQYSDLMQMSIPPNPYPNLMQMGIAPNPYPDPREMGIASNAYPNQMQMGIAPNPYSNQMQMGIAPNPREMGIAPNSYYDQMQMGMMAPNPYLDPREIGMMTPNLYQDPMQMGNAPNPYPDPKEMGGLHRDESGGGSSSGANNVYFDPIAYLNRDKFFSG